MKKINMKEVMRRAWEIAREGAKKFGGRAIEYISESLKISWKEAKRMIENVKNVKDVKIKIEANDWMKYGKHRLYIEVNMNLIELKNIKGNIVGAKRGIKQKCFYDWKNRKLFVQNFKGTGLASADDKVVEYMKNKIKKEIYKKIDQYKDVAKAKEIEINESL